MSRLPIVLLVAACAGATSAFSQVDAPVPPGPGNAASGTQRSFPARFTPATGFGGYSQGEGKLRMSLGRESAFHVESHGTEQSDGTFRLDQTVTFEGEPPRSRTWVIRTVDRDRYTATLSDAAGPVRGETLDRALVFDYRLKGPLYMHQVLVFNRDGRTIDNQAEITLLGLPVGHLHETITPRCEGTASRPGDAMPPGSLSSAAVSPR